MHVSDAGLWDAPIGINEGFAVGDSVGCGVLLRVGQTGSDDARGHARADWSRTEAAEEADGPPGGRLGIGGSAILPV